ncbi:hypothetical protein MP11Mi_20870 [Gordonia sp. MP11Mi]|uniref:Uncharacterized protein n=1 Tax=Gordonia sp. MP11Mi TaxID=3022769 RepID=A0AA97CXU0_9ACTN
MNKLFDISDIHTFIERMDTWSYRRSAGFSQFWRFQEAYYFFFCVKTRSSLLRNIVKSNEQKYHRLFREEDIPPP